GGKGDIKKQNALNGGSHRIQRKPRHLLIKPLPPNRTKQSERRSAQSRSPDQRCLYSLSSGHRTFFLLRPGNAVVAVISPFGMEHQAGKSAGAHRQMSSFRPGKWFPAGKAGLDRRPESPHRMPLPALQTEPPS